MHCQKFHVSCYPGHGCCHLISGRHEHPGAVAGLGESSLLFMLANIVSPVASNVIDVAGTYIL